MGYYRVVRVDDVWGVYWVDPCGVSVLVDLAREPWSPHERKPRTWSYATLEAARSAADSFNAAVGRRKGGGL